MAAIVRSGARRLAGSALIQRAPAAGALLQRTEAAAGVDALRRPFLARFRSSTKQPVDEIQLKKEELYDLLSATDSSGDPGNRVLLQSLSAHIKPRPNDSQWRFMRASKRRSDVLRPAGIVAGFCLGFLSILLIRGMGAARAEAISEASMEEIQQGDSANQEMALA